MKIFCNDCELQLKYIQSKSTVLPAINKRNQRFCHATTTHQFETIFGQDVHAMRIQDVVEMKLYV